MKLAIFIALNLLSTYECYAQDSIIYQLNKATGDTVIIENPFYKTSEFKYIEQMPEPGYDMFDFIRKNQKYPKDAYEAGIDGRVNVQFVVTEQGYFDSVKVLKPLYPSLNAEAMRVVKALPQPWKPGKMGGKVVRVRYTIPILFRAE